MTKQEPMEQKWHRDSYWVLSDDGDPILSLVHIENDHERIDMLDRIVTDHNFARYAALEIAGKDIKIGVQGKVIVAHKDQLASLQAEIAQLEHTVKDKTCLADLRQIKITEQAEEIAALKAENTKIEKELTVVIRNAGTAIQLTDDMMDEYQVMQEEIAKLRKELKQANIHDSYIDDPF